MTTLIPNTQKLAAFAIRIFMKRGRRSEKHRKSTLIQLALGRLGWRTWASCFKL